MTNTTPRTLPGRPWRQCHGRLRTTLVLVVVAGLACGACASSDPIAAGPNSVGGSLEHPVAVTAPPNQSLVSFGGQFLTACTFSHTRLDDPIVHFGRPGLSHQHEFFGNVTTNESSTYKSLVKAPSTCSDIGDRSAYWVPTLFIDGKRVVPRRVDAYYRVAAGIAPASVKTFPNGLQALAGDQHGSKAPSLQVAAWACGLSPNLSHTPPKNCTSDRPVQLRLTFPSCWDGTHVSTADFTSHLSYPTRKGCDTAHPVPLAQLTLTVHYPLTGTWSTGWLASGTFDTVHGDFFEAWKPQRISDQVTGCLNRAVTCGIVGGTFHTGPGNGDADSYDIAPKGSGTPHTSSRGSGDTAPTSTAPPAADSRH